MSGGLPLDIPRAIVVGIVRLVFLSFFFLVRIIMYYLEMVSVGAVLVLVESDGMQASIPSLLKIVIFE